LRKEKRTRTGERGKYRDALQSTKSDPRLKDERYWRAEVVEVAIEEELS
jgi:hypothetical protein